MYIHIYLNVITLHNKSDQLSPVYFAMSVFVFKLVSFKIFRFVLPHYKDSLYLVHNLPIQECINYYLFCNKS